MQGTYAHYIHTMTQKWSARPGLTILVNACEASFCPSAPPKTRTPNLLIWYKSV